MTSIYDFSKPHHVNDLQQLTECLTDEANAR